MINFLSGIFNVIVAAVLLLLIANYASGETRDEKNLHEEAHCLAQNVYFEARGSSLADQAAVADVAINRSLDRRYPDTICGVVRQGRQDEHGNMIRHQCQFSWYCDGKPDRPTDIDSWNEAMLIAWGMLERGRYRGITEGATHYHADYVNPRWTADLHLVGTIGRHIFYRWD
jgi:N-acetylmuramoyl-L-alanine amidase